MAQDWVAGIPTAVYFIIGMGGVAGAMLAIIKLWHTIRPRPDTTERDIETIRDDVHDIRARVAALEIEIAKIDRLYEFLLDRAPLKIAPPAAPGYDLRGKPAAGE